jgi:hypothetical protein
MSILLAFVLAQTRVLPEIDRRALDLQARAEALQTRRPAQPPTQPAERTARATPAPAAQIARSETAPAAQPVRRAAAVQTPRLPNPRRASGGALDLSAITTICRAAGNQADPATFLATLSQAYALDTTQRASLRTSCAAYLAGRADARVSNYGAPAH